VVRGGASARAGRVGDPGLVRRTFCKLGGKEMARALFISVALLLFSANAAAAQQPPPCAPWDQMVKKLKIEYSEVLVGRGIDALGRMLEIYGGPDGWTVLSVQPANMISCVMLIGQKGTQWQAVEPQPDEPKS
jgi:hypothetical protein